MSKTGIDWREQPLGQVQDAVLAERLHCTVSAVRSARVRLGVESYQATMLRLGRRWRSDASLVRENHRLRTRDRERRELKCERRFALWLTEDEYGALHALAWSSGISKAEVVKRALRAAQVAA